MADPPTTNENKETTTPDRHRHWVNPPPDKLKINCDGAFAKESKQGAWGFVIRDHEGNGVLAGAGKLQEVPNAMCAEGYACLAALEAAMNAGMAHIILETDSLCLVSTLKTESYDYSIGGTLFCEIADLLRSQFLSFEICHVPRSCNVCAHEHAKYGLSWDPDQPVVWNDPLPKFVNIWVHGDLNDRVGE